MTPFFLLPQTLFFIAPSPHFLSHALTGPLYVATHTGGQSAVMQGVQLGGNRSRAVAIRNMSRTRAQLNRLKAGGCPVFDSVKSWSWSEALTYFSAYLVEREATGHHMKSMQFGLSLGDKSPKEREEIITALAEEVGLYGVSKPNPSSPEIVVV